MNGEGIDKTGPCAINVNGRLERGADRPTDSQIA